MLCLRHKILTIFEIIETKCTKTKPKLNEKSLYEKNTHKIITRRWTRTQKGSGRYRSLHPFAPVSLALYFFSEKWNLNKIWCLLNPSDNKNLLCRASWTLDWIRPRCSNLKRFVFLQVFASGGRFNPYGL